MRRISCGTVGAAVFFGDAHSLDGRWGSVEGERRRCCGSGGFFVRWLGVDGSATFDLRGRSELSLG